MTKLTRLDKFRKAVRISSNDSKNSKSTIKKSLQDQPTEATASTSTKEIKFDKSVTNDKTNKSGVKVKKNVTKKIFFKASKDTNGDEIVNSDIPVILSRGKRKREAKKLAWKKKFEFEKTCLDILKENKSIDKHGLALGSIKELQSSLDVVEKKLIKVKKIGKKRNKVEFKLRTKKRNFKQWVGD